MNILKNIKFHSEKPFILPVRKTDNVNIIAIGLLHDQILSKHKANIPSLLLVLKGSIEFKIEDKIYLFDQFDTFQIPVDVEHEVIGKDDENIFLITQEK
ncbi:MAG: hypothetical protein ABFR05_10820 [Bacteroidota bacterium]